MPMLTVPFEIWTKFFVDIPDKQDYKKEVGIVRFRLVWSSAVSWHCTPFWDNHNDQTSNLGHGIVMLPMSLSKV